MMKSMSKVSRIVDVLGTDTISGFLYKKLFVSIFKVKRGVTILVGVIPILYTKTAFSQTILIAIYQDTRLVIVQVTLPVSFLLVRLNKGVSRSSTLLKRTTTLLFGVDKLAIYSPLSTLDTNSIYDGSTLNYGASQFSVLRVTRGKPMANIHAPIMTDYNGHFGNGSNPLGETRANGTRLEAVVALSLRKSFIMIDQTEDNSSVNVTESMWYWYSDKSILIDDGSDRG